MQPLTIKRITKELEQIRKEPVEGISLVQIDKNDYSNFIVNLRIQQGPYKGSIAHCSLQLSEKHPQVAPFMTIFLGCGFEEAHHHHLFKTSDQVKFCIDILRDSVLTSNEIGSGWNAAYTIKTLLMQIQQFISDPDRGDVQVPEEVIIKFQQNNYNFEREFEVNGEKVKHNFSLPFPPFVRDNLSLNDNPLILASKNNFKITKEEEEEQQSPKQLLSQTELREKPLSNLEINEINQFVKEVNDLYGEYIDEYSTDSKYQTPKSSNSITNELDTLEDNQNVFILEQNNYQLSKEKHSIYYQSPLNRMRGDIEELLPNFTNQNLFGFDITSQVDKGIYHFRLEKEIKESKCIYENDQDDIYSSISDSQFKDCVNISLGQEEIEEEQYIDYSTGVLDKQFIREHLTCYMTLTNPIDDHDQVFGLPVHLEVDEFGKLQSQALTEILSYEGFQTILNENGLEKMNYKRKPIKGQASRLSKQYPVFKSSHGNAFNCWLPLFIDREHFEKNIKIIEKSISELSFFEGMEFKPFMVLEIIPNLINKMFVKIFDSQEGKISTVAIQAYIQMFQLLINFCERYPCLQDTIDKRIIDFARSDFNRNKQVIGDFGEFFVILGASSFSFNQFEFLDLLYREQSARQMLWLENNEEFMIEFTSYPQPNPPSLSEKEIENLNPEEKKEKLIELEAYRVQCEQVYENQMQSVWRQHKIGPNLLVFTIEAAKFLTSRQFLKKIEKNYSLVSDEYAAHFIQYTRHVRSLINSHKDFLNYLGLGQKYDTFEKVQEAFQIGIFVSNYQGYTRKKNEIDNNIHEFKPILKHFSLECKRLFNLRLKSQVEAEEKRLPKILEKITLDQIKLNGLKEDLNNYEMMDFSKNKIFEQEEQQRSDIFNKSILSFSKDTSQKIDLINKRLKSPLVDQFQSNFVKKMEDQDKKYIQHQIQENNNNDRYIPYVSLDSSEKQKASEKFYKYTNEDTTTNRFQWRNQNNETVKVQEQSAVKKQKSYQPSVNYGSFRNKMNSEISLSNENRNQII